MSVSAVREFLARHGLTPNRDLGQNFLVDEQLVEKLVTSVGVGESDVVIEIGTGLGILTRSLAKRAQKVITLEIDAGLVRALRAEDALPSNVELLHADALAFDFEALLARVSKQGPVRIVANLPYSVSSPLLRRFLDLREKLVDWTVMLQSEVAERLIAEPNSRDYGSLTVLHQICVTTERMLDVPPPCFYPVPKIHSKVLRMTPRAEVHLAAGGLEEVERVVRAAFGQRRKMLPKALANGLGTRVSGEQILHALAEVGIERTLRAEAVSSEKFLALARVLAARKGAPAKTIPIRDHEA